MEVKDLSRTIQKIYDSLADVVFDETKMPTDVATEIAKTGGVKDSLNGENYDEIQTILDAIIADLEKEIEKLNIAGEFTKKTSLEAKRRTVQTGFGFLTESRKKVETFLSSRGKYDEQKYHTERKEDLERKIASNKNQQTTYEEKNQGLYDYAEDLRKYSELVKAYEKLKDADVNLRTERANGDSDDVQRKTEAQIDKILEEIEGLGQGLDGATIAYEKGKDNQATITAKITELQNARTQRYNEFGADTLIDATVKAQYADADALEKFYDTYNAKIASLRVKREALNQQLSDSEERLAAIEKDNGDIRKVYDETGTLKTDKQIGKEALEDTEMAQQVGEKVEQYSNFRTGFGSKFKYFRDHGQNPFQAFISAFAGKKKMKMLVAADLQKGKVVGIQEREKTAREKFGESLRKSAQEHYAANPNMDASKVDELITRAYGDANKAKKASANEQREPEGEEH